MTHNTQSLCGDRSTLHAGKTVWPFCCHIFRHSSIHMLGGMHNYPTWCCLPVHMDPAAPFGALNSTMVLLVILKAIAQNV